MRGQLQAAKVATSAITEMALKLGAAFRTTPEFWLNAQKAVDLHRAARHVTSLPLCASAGRAGAPVDHHGAALHDPAHAVDDGSDISEGVAVDCDDVSVASGRHRAPTRWPSSNTRGT